MRHVGNPRLPLLLFNLGFEIAFTLPELGQHKLQFRHLAALLVDLKLVEPDEGFPVSHHSVSSECSGRLSSMAASAS